MKDLVRLIRESVGESYDLEDLGSGDYLVHTGKYFDDGDELHIVLKVQGDGYELTDEGTRSCGSPTRITTSRP